MVEGHSAVTVLAVTRDFGVFPRREVDHEAAQCLRTPVFADDRDDVTQPESLAVAASHAIFKIVRAAILDRRKAFLDCDLFYRLNVFPIWIPPLRDRPEDVPLLVRYLTHKHATRLKRTIATIPKAIMDELMSCDWPGNIRELENVIERAVILSPEGVLRLPPSTSPVQSRMRKLGIQRRYQ